MADCCMFVCNSMHRLYDPVDVTTQDGSSPVMLSSTAADRGMNNPARITREPNLSLRWAT